MGRLTVAGIEATMRRVILVTGKESGMLRHTLLGILLTLLFLATPAAGSEQALPSLATPVVHEELGGALEELTGQFHGLRARLREHFAQREARGERPLITLMLRHREELGLSREQVQGLEQLRADFQREALRREAELRLAETELGTLLDADVPDLGQVEAKLRAIGELGAELRLARIRAIEQGKGLLTQDQRAKLRALLAEPRSPRPRAGAAPPRGEQF